MNEDEAINNYGINENTEGSQESTTPNYVIDNPQKAISMLVQGVELAQKRGVFNISESKLMYDSICFFFPDYSIEEKAKQLIKENKLKESQDGNN